MKKRLRFYLYLLLITPICFELALRILGYGVFYTTDYSISSEPKMCLQSSSDLGFSLGEGEYSVQINGAQRYSATHHNGKRISHLNAANDSLMDVFIMGCSFTYGMGVTDSVSFPFQVQNHFDNLDVHNFGVPGFGNVQSYLQLKKEVESGNTPDFVIINFCDFHHERNSMTPKFRKSLVMGYQRSNNEVSAQLKESTFPFIENKNLKTIAFENLYSNWAGRETFVSINYLQSFIDRVKTSKLDLEQNSLFVFLEMKKLCDKHGIDLLVTGLTKNAATRSFLSRLKKAQILTTDISLDLTHKKYNQLPFDSHPNVRAHKHFAKEISRELERWISSRSPAN